MNQIKSAKLAKPASAKIASALHSVQHVFVRDLELMAHIGIFSYEKRGPQPIIINVDLAVAESNQPIDDNIENVVCYRQGGEKIRKLLARGHVRLVETLAEDIAQACLETPAVLSVRVRIEKPQAIEEAASVGIEIERLRVID